MTRWIEDWFGSDYYCMLYKHRGLDEAKLFLDNLVSLLHLPVQSKILDCGCGKGRHSIYLAEKGFEVTGIDISEKNIAAASLTKIKSTVEAGQIKKQEKKNLNFYTHDMRNLFRLNYYDVALSLFTSFGYFQEDSENNKAIKSIASSLKKNGWFVLDFMNAEKEIKKIVAEEVFQMSEINFKVKRFIEGDFIIKEISVTDNEKIYSFSERVKTYTRKYLENFFIQNKLEVVHLFGDYTLTSFNEITSERLILIGRKI